MPSRRLVDGGVTLTEANAFDSNLGTDEKDATKAKYRGFVTEFLKRLISYDGNNSSLRAFCRVDVSIFVDENKTVSFFVNEVERGLTTCLFSTLGSNGIGHIGTDFAWLLAGWIDEERERLEGMNANVRVE